MGILRYAVVAGIGYYAGQPEGRRQLTTLRRRAAELARGPEVRRLRERGWDMVGEGALATRNLAAKARSKEDRAGGAPDGRGAAITRVARDWSPWRRTRPDTAAPADPTAGTDPAELNGSAGVSGPPVSDDSEAADLATSAPPPLAADARPAAPPEDRR